MATCYVCPFFKNRLRGNIYCEFAVIKPPDDRALAEFAQEFCANENGYKNCKFYKLLNEYYERKYCEGEKYATSRGNIGRIR